MMVLSRKPGDTIRIADDIVIEVLDVRGTSVELGVTAPAAAAKDRVSEPGQQLDAPAPKPERDSSMWLP